MVFYICFVHGLIKDCTSCVCFWYLHDVVVVEVVVVVVMEVVVVVVNYLFIYYEFYFLKDQSMFLYS